MTLDDLERRNSLYFAFFSPISIYLLAKYVAVVEYRPTSGARARSARA